MATRRDAILTGTAKAAELHAELRLREKLRSGDRPVDVLGAIRAHSITVLFRPLDGLLGAYVPTPRSAGMLVTTLRDHHVQRFTAAHELGHHVLGHKVPSFDKQVGFVARGERDGYAPQEIEADAFAAEFLLPKWLIVAHARRRQWGTQDLQKADVAYQLSLRLGVSYAATCWALASANLVPLDVARQLAERPPKESKQRAIAGMKPTSWYPDVWVLSQHDQGAQLLGSPEDYFVFNLPEHVAGGYEWDVDAMPDVGLAVRRDERIDNAPESMGGTVQRQVIAQGSGLRVGRLALAERRPWETRAQSLNTFEVDLALLGKEPVGLPRPERLLAA
jgi:Zn-dependent peptidase ImmA (M78 family)